MKLFLRIASAAIICASLFSSASAVEMSLGIKGGLNLANLYAVDDNADIEPEMKMGLNIGALLELKLTDMFSIQPEVLFTSKGCKIEESDEDMTMSVGLSMNYVEIPVLFKVNFPAGTVNPTIFAGPAIAFKVGTNASAEIDGDVPAEYQDMVDEMLGQTEDMMSTLIDESTKGIDFGIAMGAGLAIPAGSGSVLLEFRYTLGLLDIADTSDFEDASIAKHSVIAISAGYAFNIGG